MADLRRLLLCASKDAGVGVLDHVIARSDIDDLAVLTHPTLPGFADVKRRASEVGVWCSTESINTVSLPFEPDAVSLVYFDEIVGPKLVEKYRNRIFNAHPSLLPRHRGCSAVPWSIIEGDEETGVTYHYVVERVDAGNVILQQSIPIGPRETQRELYVRLMDLTVELWPSAWQRVTNGLRGTMLKGEGCIHTRGAPFGGAIDESWSDDKVERFIRAMTLPPLPYATYRGVEVRTMDEYLEIRSRER